MSLVPPPSHPASPEQGLVPVLLAKSRAAAAGRLPTVIFLHATGKDRTQMWPQMVLLARRGFLAVSIDARYHGARATGGSSTYKRALIRVRYSDAQGRES
jgi:predicted esterase